MVLFEAGQEGAGEELVVDVAAPEDVLDAVDDEVVDPDVVLPEAMDKEDDDDPELLLTAEM